MIKLQVNHSNHPKESGGKLEIGKKNQKKSIEKDALPPVDKPTNQNKKDQKGSKDAEKPKDEKKGKDKKDQKDEKKSKQQSPSKNDKNDKNKKAVTKEDPKNALIKGKSEPIDKNSKDKQKQTIQNINKQQKKAKMTIEELIQYYKDAASDMFSNHGHDPQKQKEIEKQLSLLQQQKEKRKNKIQSLQNKKESIKQSKQNAQKIKMELKLQKQKERKIKKIQKHLSTLETNAKERNEAHKKFIEYSEEKKKIKPRYKIYEDRFEQFLEKQREEYQEKKQEIKKKYEPLDPEEIDNFDKVYISQKEQSIAYRKNKVALEKQMLKEENERFKEIWKGNCHQNVKEERQQLKLIKKQPKAKLERLKQYGKQIQEELKKATFQRDFQMKDDQKMNDDATSSKNSEVSDVYIYREKYLNGVNLGMVALQKKIPLTIEEKVQKGNQYLQMVYNLPKKRQNLSESLSSARSQSDTDKKCPQTYKLKRKSNPLYSIQEKGKSIELKNYESIQYSIQNIRSKGKDLNLHNQIIKYGQYSNVLQVQQKKRKVNSILASQISRKLDLLKQI